MIGRHLERVRGRTLSPEERRAAIHKSFDSYARYWMESFRVPYMSGSDLDARVSVEGFEHMHGGFAKGNGVIMAAPHLGSWDLAGAWLAARGVRATVVAEVVDPPELFEWFTATRQRVGMTVVPLDSHAGSVLLRALHNNELVGLVCDRDIGGGGVEVEFFGERTTLPGGPATLALRTGAALLPIGVYAVDGRRHRGVIRPPLPVERTGRLRDDVVRVTQLLAHELEDLIRESPEEWHMFQPNWPSDSA
jgi:KDO2-lipid IV(A) lauroyltransferase